MRTRNLPETARAQALRAEPTEAEEKLWRRLRDRRLGGAKFVREAPVGPYYADFLCRSCKLVVEVDGAKAGAKADAFVVVAIVFFFFPAAAVSFLTAERGVEDDEVVAWSLKERL